MFNINNINLTTKPNYLNMEKHEFQKDCAISIQQKCELHKPGKANINFDEIALYFENLVPNTISIQSYHSLQTFPQLKFIFFSLEICKQLGNC